jgi:hypothetical protein
MRIITKSDPSGAGSDEDLNWMMTFINGNEPRFRAKTSTGGSALISNTQVTLNEWHHYAATYDGSEMKIYIDGQEVASQTKTGALLNDNWPVVIGAHTGTGSRYFKGKLDDIAVISKALDQSEVQAVRDFGIEAFTQVPPGVPTFTVNSATNTPITVSSGDTFIMNVDNIPAGQQLYIFYGELLQFPQTHPAVIGTIHANPAYLLYRDLNPGLNEVIGFTVPTLDPSDPSTFVLQAFLRDPTAPLPNVVNIGPNSHYTVSII